MTVGIKRDVIAGTLVDTCLTNIVNVVMEELDISGFIRQHKAGIPKVEDVERQELADEIRCHHIWSEVLPEREMEKNQMEWIIETTSIQSIETDTYTFECPEDSLVSIGINYKKSYIKVGVHEYEGTFRHLEFNVILSDETTFRIVPSAKHLASSWTVERTSTEVSFTYNRKD